MQEEQTISIKAFAQKLREKVDAFEKNWERNNQKDPKGYPNALGDYDWHEQWESFYQMSVDDEQ